MAMAAGAMVRGTSPSSLLRSPSPPLRSPSPAVSIPSGEVCEDMSASGKIRGDPTASGKICEVAAVEAGGSGGRRELLNTDKVTDTAAVAADASFTAARFPASSSMRTQQHQPQESSETCGELQRSSETRMEQRDGSEVPRSLLASNKRSKKVPIKNSEKTSLTTGRRRAKMLLSESW